MFSDFYFYGRNTTIFYTDKMHQGKTMGAPARVDFET
jgi:hypothetical protein